MLNSPVKVGLIDETAPEVEISGVQVSSNPFPGLRPFTMEECYLFFGREGQVDEILLKLHQHRSVTVLGFSGSGKSSLMYCGLLPMLYGGFATDTSSSWSIFATRPGASPINNLTESILKFLIEAGRIQQADVHIHRAIISSVLRSGPDGLVEIAKFVQTHEGENVFFLFDQFEELFRSFENKNEDSVNEATAYINLILTAVRQKQVPIYVTVSMRSDFIGSCAVFQGLTEFVNESNYFIPHLTREQKRMVIEGPVAVSGAKIAPRLVKRLLNDINDNQDQLPILQHAMMRTWEYWWSNHDQGELIDIRHYNAIGKVGQALSLHANEAYEELDSRQREIAEVLFKSITEKNQESQGTRRPAQIGLMAELAGAQEQEVIDVIENFRKPGRSFLMPGSHTTLNGETVIELSHESLMRIWTRLATWVEEEFESAQMYKRISEASTMYQTGRTGLWRPPDLQLALNWQKKQRPTRAWGKRYDEAFERAIVFLDTSRITYEAELKNQEMLQHRMLRRARATNIVLASFLVVTITFFLFGLFKSIQAEKNLEEASLQRDKAEQASQEAQTQRDIAEKTNQEITQKQFEIQNQRDLLDVTNKNLKRQMLRSDSLRRLAVDNYKAAEEQTYLAEQARQIADMMTGQADSLRILSENRLMLSIAQSLEAKSEGIDDKDLAGSTALQGYLFHKKYGGKKYDPYIFRGLYYALTKLYGATYNAVKMPGNYKSKTFTLVVSQSSTNFYTTGNDGRIFQGDYMTLKMDKVLSEKKFPNRALTLSKDEKYLVNASDSSYVEVYNLLSINKEPLIIRGHQQKVTDVKFLPNNSGFVSSSIDKTLRLNNPTTGESKLMQTFPYEIKSIDISTDGKWLAAASTSGKLMLMSLGDYTYKELKDEGPNRILSVTFHPSRLLIAYGVEAVAAKRGTVKLFDINTMKVVKELTGHKAGVSDVEFSPDGSLLASAGLDRKLQMWVVGHIDDLPIVLDNNNGYVWSLAFSKKSDYLLASFNDGEVRMWPTDPKLLADKICPKLNRNMTQEEWDIYVGNEVPYEQTCKTSPKDN